MRLARITAVAVVLWSVPAWAQPPSPSLGDPLVVDNAQGTVNVRRFGALCNGVADDTAAFQAAINASAQGSTIVVPPGTCMISSALSFKDKINLRVIGSGGGTARTIDDILSTNIVYTGSSGALILAEGARGLELGWLNLSYSDPAFSLILINLAQGSGVMNTGWVYIHDCRIGGRSTSSKAAAALIYLNLTNDVDIERCMLLNADVGILGSSESYINANRVSIRQNWFQSTFGTSGIKAGGQAWTIEGNIFEPRDGSTTAAALTLTTAGVKGLSYIGNWHGDGTTGTWVNATAGVLGGAAFIGNDFGGCNTAIDLGGADGVLLSGNRLEAPMATGIVAGAATNVTATANSMTGVTTRVSGNPSGNSFVDGQLSLASNLTGRNYHAINTTPAANALLLYGGTFTPTGFGTAYLDRVITTVAGQPNQTIHGVSLAPTFNRASSGTHPLLASFFAAPPIVGGGTATVDEASTVHISGAPTVGTRKYALHVAGGTTRLSDVELREVPAPSCASPDTARLMAIDNGAGKTQLVVQFPDCSVQVLAGQP